MEVDNLNGILPFWKTILIEDNLNVRQHERKTTSMEDNLNGRQRTSIKQDLNEK